MKKISKLIAVLVLCLAMAACGGSSKTSSSVEKGSDDAVASASGDASEYESTDAEGDLDFDNPTGLAAYAITFDEYKMYYVLDFDEKDFLDIEMNDDEFEMYYGTMSGNYRDGVTLQYPEDETGDGMKLQMKFDLPLLDTATVIDTDGEEYEFRAETLETINEILESPQAQAYMDDSSDAEEGDYIAVPESSDTYKNQDVDAVVESLEDAGFTNVYYGSTYGTEWTEEELGRVEEVEIDSETDFAGGDSFPKDAEVIVWYYADAEENPEIDNPTSVVVYSMTSDDYRWYYIFDFANKEFLDIELDGDDLELYTGTLSGNYRNGVTLEYPDDVIEGGMELQVTFDLPLMNTATVAEADGTAYEFEGDGLESLDDIWDYPEMQEYLESIS